MTVVVGPSRADNNSSGTLMTFGRNDAGQLGDGTVCDEESEEGCSRSTPGDVLEDVSAVAGGAHTLALASGGQVWSWGDNFFGQLGDGTTDNRTNPGTVSGLTGVFTAVAASRFHSLALRSDGTLWAWGSNRCGELGASGSSPVKSPVLVEGPWIADGHKITAIAAGTGVFGGGFSLAVTDGGEVYSWGYNLSGELGDGTVGTPAGTNGFLVCSRNAIPRKALLPPGAEIVSVSAGGPAFPGGHSLALAKDGTVWAWGENTFGQLGRPHSPASPVPLPVAGLGDNVVTDIAAGGRHSLAVTVDGTVYAWGDNASGQLGTGQPPGPSGEFLPAAVADLQSATQVAAGELHSLARTSDGQLWAWGHNGYGQIGQPQTTTTKSPKPMPVSGVDGSVNGLAAGGHHSLAIRTEEPTDRTLPSTTTTTSTVGSDPDHSERRPVLAFGDNGAGQLGDGTAQDRRVPTEVLGLRSATAVAGGFQHSLATAMDGRVWAWGENGYGQLGDGTTEPRNTARPVPDLDRVAAIAAGSYHSLALREDGTVWAWGSNHCGELGAPGREDRSTPVQVALPESVTITAIAAGSAHSLAVSKDGTVYAWGSNGSGQLGNGRVSTHLDCRNETPSPVMFLDGSPAVAAVAAGGGGGFGLDGHSLAVTTDGTVYAWGANTYGQLARPNGPASPLPLPVAGLDGKPVAVAAGESHSLTVLEDGRVYSWGNNVSGQLGSGTATSEGVIPATSFAPLHVGGVKAATAVTGGASHSLALSADGSVYGWGANDEGQLGDGTTTSRPTAGPVAGMAGAVAVAAGYQHSLLVAPTAEAPQPPPAPPAACPDFSSSTTSEPTVGGTPHSAEDNPWVAHNSKGFTPPGSTGTAMAYHPPSRRVVLFGGLSSGLGARPRAETWVWDGSTSAWTNVTPPPAPPGEPPTSPSARYGAAMAYDADSEKLVLFGGTDGGVTLDDTWTWDGQTWRQHDAETAPAGRYGAVMAAHPDPGGIVLFGGAAEPAGLNGRLLCDTWTWSNGTWTYHEPTATPPARVFAAMAYHNDSGEAVLFGGQGRSGTDHHVANDTWTWDGQDWRARASHQKPRRGQATMASLPATGHVVLVGEAGAGTSTCGHEGVRSCPPQTWTWDGSGWTRRLPSGSPPSVGAMAYDAPRQRVMLFTGARLNTPLGTGVFDETWTWDGKVNTNPVRPSTSGSLTLELDPWSIPADGRSTSTATATMRLGGQPWSHGTVQFRTNGDVTIGAVTNHGDGTYSATVTASRTEGEETVTAYGYAVEGGTRYETTAILTETAAGEQCAPPPGGSEDGTGVWTDLDAAFGCNGVALHPLGEDGQASDIAVQPDGRIVVVGWQKLARFLPDGSIDRDFGDNGETALPHNATEVELLPDGKIMVHGPYGLSRLNADGTLDPAFGEGGSVPAAQAAAMTIQQHDGEAKIVRVGSAPSDDLTAPPAVLGFWNFAVYRYNADGSPDEGFGRGGSVVTRFDTYSGASDVSIDHQGRIVVAGAAGSADYGSTKFAAARYLPNGQLDTTFNPCIPPTGPPCDGVVKTDLSPANRNHMWSVSKVTIQPDGRILLLGTADHDDGPGFAMVRYNVDVAGRPDGTLDTSFNPCSQVPQPPCGGTVVGPTEADFPARDPRGSARFPGAYAREAAVQPTDGRIVVVGFGPIPDADFLVARYGPDGILESCGSPGTARTRVAFAGGAYGVEVLPDGKIMAAGSYSASGDESGTAVVRYMGNGGPDGPCGGLAIADAAPVEVPESGTRTARFTVSLDQALSEAPVPGPPLPPAPVKVSYTTENRTATANEDYTPTSGTLVFAPGERTKPIEVPVHSSAVVNGTESFVVKLSEPVGAPISRDTGTGTIVAPTPRLAIGDQVVTEPFAGEVPAKFTVNLDRAVRHTVSVGYTTSDHSAEAGSDYTVTTGRLEIPAGATSAIVAVPVLGDRVPEDSEEFFISLHDPVGADIARGRGTGTIGNATPGLSVGDARVSEGDTGMTPAVFSVSLDEASAEAVTVDYATADGSAQAGTDYVAALGTVRFEPGQVAHSVTVDVLTDTVVEGTETFTLALAGPSGGTVVARAQGTGTIFDDDDEEDPLVGGPGSPAEAAPPVPLGLVPPFVAPRPPVAAVLPPVAPPPPVVQPFAQPQPVPQGQAQAQPQPQPQPQAQTQAQAQAQAAAQAQGQAQGAAQAAMMAERDRETQVARAHLSAKDAGPQTHLASVRRSPVPLAAPVAGWVAAVAAAGIALARRPGNGSVPAQVPPGQRQSSAAYRPQTRSRRRRRPTR